MTANDELREAAERIVRYRDGESHESVWPDPGDGMVTKDAPLLADAFLAAITADSDEPITEEWLREIGFEKGATFFEITVSGVRLGLSPYGSVMIMGSSGNTHYKTRRQLRNLLAALKG